MAAFRHWQRYSKSQVEPLGQKHRTVFPDCCEPSTIHLLINDPYFHPDGPYPLQRARIVRIFISGFAYPGRRADLSLQRRPSGTSDDLHVTSSLHAIFVAFGGCLELESLWRSSGPVLWASSLLSVTGCLYLPTLKMCIAITSLGTTSTSSYWACEFIILSPVFP
jgi:hypothetical protein